MIEQTAVPYPILVDPMDNPVWCTFAYNPNTGYLIGVDGKARGIHVWIRYEEMAGIVDDYLGELWKSSG